MADSAVMKIKCPLCQTTGEFTIYPNINVTKNPEMKKKIISGELFMYECPHCHKKGQVDYGPVYHDMDKRLMIIDCKDEKEGLKLFAQFKEELKDLDPSEVRYRFRIVKDCYELKEKIMIFDEGLDDRGVEVSKFLNRLNVKQNYPDFVIKRVYFNKLEDGSCRFEYIDPNNKMITIPVEGEMKETLKGFFEKENPDEVIINEKWAEKVIENSGENDQAEV